MIISNSIFFEEVHRAISQGNSVKIPMRGNSMSPMLRDKLDVLVLSSVCFLNVKIGDVLLFENNGSYVLHRLIAIDGDQCHFRGDGNLDRGEFVDRTSVIARLDKIQRPSGKVVQLDSTGFRVYWFLWRNLFPIRRLILAIWRRLR